MSISGASNAATRKLKRARSGHRQVGREVAALARGLVHAALERLGQPTEILGIGVPACLELRQLRLEERAHVAGEVVVLSTEPEVHAVVPRSGLFFGFSRSGERICCAGVGL